MVLHRLRYNLLPRLAYGRELIESCFTASLLDPNLGLDGAEQHVTSIVSVLHSAHDIFLQLKTTGAQKAYLLRSANDVPKNQQKLIDSTQRFTFSFPLFTPFARSFLYYAVV